jgi:hypothetical protein
MALHFGVSLKGGEPEYIRVRRWPFRIGRSPKCDLCLANSSRISRQHARVVKNDGSYYFIPRGKNATFLNGELLARDAIREINHGDTIELPDYTLIVRDTNWATHASSSTTNIPQVTSSTVIERMVASALGIRRWTHGGIYDWLQDRRGREIRIQHQQMELNLNPGLTQIQVAKRLELFDTFFEMIDPRNVSVDVVDPKNAY